MHSRIAITTSGYGQDSWRVSENLTVNLGLRLEWEDGIKEDTNAMVTDFDPDAKLAISDLAEAAYARAPVAQVPASQFRVRGGPVYASAAGQDGKAWRPQTLFMPRVSAAYRLGEKTVFKAGYGLFYDTLNAADYNANNLGYNSTTTVTNSTDFGQTFALGDPRNGVLGISDPFPVRNGQRFDQPFDDRLGADAGAGVGVTTQNQNHEHTRLQRWRVGIQREVARNLSVEFAYDGSYHDRREISIRQDYLPERSWITGSGTTPPRRRSPRTWRIRPDSRTSKRFGRAIPSCISGCRRTRSSRRRPFRPIACCGRSRTSTT